MKKEALTLEEKDKDKKQAADDNKAADETAAGGDKDEKQAADETAADGKKDEKRAAEDDKAADKKTVGGNIRAFRKQQGMTQERLASKIGEDVSNKTVSRYESGGDHMSMCTFLKIAEILGVTPNDLSPSRLLVNRPKIPPEYYELNAENRADADNFIRALKLKQDTTG